MASLWRCTSAITKSTAVNGLSIVFIIQEFFWGTDYWENCSGCGNRSQQTRPNIRVRNVLEVASNNEIQTMDGRDSVMHRVRSRLRRHDLLGEKELCQSRNFFGDLQYSGPLKQLQPFVGHREVASSDFVERFLRCEQIKSRTSFIPPPARASLTGCLNQAR